MVTTYAVTLSDLIEKGGAYAGLAAFFGLAILAILYFAQAREIRRLREWAGRAPERAQELEARVSEQAEQSRRVVAVPSRRPGEPATAAAKKPAPLAAKPTPPAKPAADAPTTVVPKPEAPPADGAEEPSVPAPDTPKKEEEGSPTEHPVVVSAAAEGDDTPDEAESTESDAVPAGATTALTPPAEDEPATPANGAPPAEDVPVTLPPRATQGPPVRRPAPAAAPLRASGSVSRRPPAGTSAIADAGDDPRRGRLIIAGVVAGLVLIVIGLVAILGGGDDKTAKQPTAGRTQPAPTAAAKTPAPSKGNKTPTASRSDTNVAVLNGTTVAGLAGTINDRLEQAGYTAIQNPADYTDQARSASVVFYNGSGNRTQAIEIAKQLDISDRQPIIDEAAQLAPGADVVVVVGADQSP